MHVSIIAEHMFECNSGATLKSQHYGSRQYKYGSAPLSYIRRLQGIHTFLCKACPFSFTAESRPSGLLPSLSFPWAILPGQRREYTLSPHHDNVPQCKITCSVFPELLNEYNFNSPFFSIHLTFSTGILKNIILALALTYSLSCLSAPQVEEDKM